MELAPERSYADRLKLLALLSERHPYPSGVGDQRAGILLQTKWQDRSGRAILDGSGRLHTWWPIANWTLTVWQLEALQRRGEFADVTLGERMVPLPDDVAAAIVDYYDGIDAALPARELQRRLWHFHVGAIEHGLVAAEPLLHLLDEAEARFAEAWGRTMVGLLAAVNFPTEFESVRGQQKLLPPRLLCAADWQGAGDLLAPQVSTMLAMRALHDDEKTTGGALLGRLTRLAETAEGERSAANQLFETLAFGGENAAEFLRARLESGSNQSK